MGAEAVVQVAAVARAVAAEQVGAVVQVAVVARAVAAEQVEARAVAPAVPVEREPLAVRVVPVEAGLPGVRAAVAQRELAPPGRPEARPGPPRLAEQVRLGPPPVGLEQPREPRAALRPERRHPGTAVRVRARPAVPGVAASAAGEW